jgi:hypothetical protein
MKVRVTREDIKNGVRGDMCKCPIALAVNRKTGWQGMRGARVHNQHRAGHPVDDFITQFDAGLPVKPQTFNFPELDPSFLYGGKSYAETRGYISSRD